MTQNSKYIFFIFDVKKHITNHTLNLLAHNTGNSEKWFVHGSGSTVFVLQNNEAYHAKSKQDFPGVTLSFHPFLIFITAVM